MEEKLDRALVASEWIGMFPSFKILNVITLKFDHSPIIPKLNDGGKINFKKRFSFENYWLLEPELNDVLKLGWFHPDGHDFLSKLSITSTEMNSWGN